MLNSNLCNSIDAFDMRSYGDLSHAFNELHENITSLYLENKTLN